MGRRLNLLQPIVLFASLFLIFGVMLEIYFSDHVGKSFSVPSEFSVAKSETVLVTVMCLESLAEYTCTQSDEQYDLVRSAYQELTEKCSDCDILTSSASGDRPSRIGLVDTVRMHEMGPVDFCFSGERLNDTLVWRDKWLHAAIFSTGTVISEVGFSYTVSTKWLMKNLDTGELAIVVDPDGKGYIDPNGDTLDIYYPCGDKSEENLIGLLRTFGAIF